MAFLWGRKDLEILCRDYGASRDQLAYLSDDDVVEEKQRQSLMAELADKYKLRGDTPCQKRELAPNVVSTIAERVKRRRRRAASESDDESTTTAPVSALD